VIHLALFVFGLLLGSHLNVLAVRYKPETGFKPAQKGRSKCPHCGHTLRWLELIPVLSFIVQGGKCRECKKRVSLQYPIAEILTGLVLLLVPFQLGFTFSALIWTLALLVFIVISLVDLRLHIIPDRLNVAIILIGLALFVFKYTGGAVESFLGTYALIFRFAGENLFADTVLGIIFGGMLFGGIYYLSRGRAMGFGDVKLALAIGFLMGWPDAALAFILSFIVGSIVGVILMATGKKGMKSAIPFGPFMVFGVTLTLFFGYDIINGYFQLFDIF